MGRTREQAEGTSLYFYDYDKSRDTFRSVLSLDNATWARGRCWTLWKALIVYAELSGTNPLEIENSRRVINEILADYRQR